MGETTIMQPRQDGDIPPDLAHVRAMAVSGIWLPNKDGELVPTTVTVPTLVEVRAQVRERALRYIDHPDVQSITWAGQAHAKRLYREIKGLGAVLTPWCLGASSKARSSSPRNRRTTAGALDARRRAVLERALARTKMQAVMRSAIAAALAFQAEGPVPLSEAYVAAQRVDGGR